MVYHGAPIGFTAFTYDAKGVNDYGDADLGFFFGSSDVANAFAGGEEGVTVLPVYLSIKNPKVIQGAEFVKMLDSFKLNRPGFSGGSTL